MPTTLAGIVYLHAVEVRREEISGFNGRRAQVRKGDGFGFSPDDGCSYATNKKGQKSTAVHGCLLDRK